MSVGVATLMLVSPQSVEELYSKWYIRKWNGSNVPVAESAT